MEAISAEEVIAMIDRIIEEHKVFIHRVQTLEQVANDAQAMLGLEKAQEAFMPGRLKEKKSLQKMQELLETTDQGLQAHFDREETTLLTAFEKHGGRTLVSALRTLLLEHEGLRNRFAQSKEHVAELIGGGLSRHLWEASAHDMRAHITHTRTLLEAHAQIEQELLHFDRAQKLLNNKACLP